MADPIPHDGVFEDVDGGVVVPDGPTVARQDLDVTGAYTVAIDLPSGPLTGLAILSQEDGKVTGMIGPADTDMMPTDGRVDGSTLTLETHPRTGRSAAFAKCEVKGTRERLTGTIDGDKGTIEFVRKPRRE